MLSVPCSFFGQQWVRVNQLGYMPQSIKVAVYISTDNADAGEFHLCDAATGAVCLYGKGIES